MKRLLAVFTLLAMFCCASAALAAEPVNLVGVWEGAPSVHDLKGGYFTGKLVLTIVEQKGNAFHGTKTYRLASKKERSEGFSGTISTTGQIFIADHDEGYMVGGITKGGEIELQYGHAGKNAAAVHVLLKKK